MADREYQSLLSALLRTGERVQTRNAPTRRLYPWTIPFFRCPLVCVRKTAWKNALREWEWFMSGSSHIDDLHPSVRSWWEPWAGKDRRIHNNYSDQFRSFNGVDAEVDQIELLVDGIANHPYSRRNVITTWNTADMHSDRTPITNCHGTVIQAFVDAQNGLHLIVYQRSMDVVCGMPHNLIQYWAFMMWLAKRCNRNPHMIYWIGGDVHLYDIHEELAKRIVDETPNDLPPQLVYTPTSDIDFKSDDFTLDGLYEPKIIERAEMVV